MISHEMQRAKVNQSEAGQQHAMASRLQIGMGLGLGLAIGGEQSQDCMCSLSCFQVGGLGAFVCGIVKLKIH